MTSFQIAVRCPDVKNQEDVMIVTQSLNASPGIGMINVDYHNHVVRFMTSNQDGGKDAISRLIAAGYEPEE